MLAKELIDQLERRGLLDQDIIEALREQLDEGGTRVTPEAVAKLLVDNGQLTRFQATKLIGEIRSGEYADADAVEATSVQEDDLAIVADEGDGVVEVEAEVASEVPVEVVAVEAEPVEAEPVEAEPVAVEAVDASVADVPKPARSRPRPKPPETKSVWDSFKIYGYAGIIGLLLLVGGGLYFVLNRGSADDAIDVGNKLYDQQNYSGAQDQYLGFLASFGEETQYSSMARVRIRMCELYRASTMSDPTRALDLADEILPDIENEEAMDQERGNLAALLVDIADNIAEKANDAPETEVKKELLGRLNEQITLMDNPMYMTSSMRATLATRLTKVQEARKRIERDISRNLKLDKAVTEMTAALKDKDTKKAYDIRFELLRSFPELEANDRIVKLILSASEIQQTLVTASTKLPKTVDGAADSESIRTIVLSNTQGRDVPSLLDEILYLRAAGSVLAFNAGNGKLLWRSFVGYGHNHEPVRLEGGAGVLLSESEKLEIQRRRGEDGSMRWRSQIAEPFHEPIVERDDVYVATNSGSLLLLDAEAGDAKWSAKIPQSLDVGPGVDSRANLAFLPGDHSNVYVINTRNGSCVDSYYLGHSNGTIVVPPVPLLGHLFVIENAAADYAMVHVLKIAEDGSLTKAQDSVRMTGNVKISPIIIQQRRLIVLTDRGQVSVYDVEPTAETDQVDVVARQLASYDEPTSTQMAVGKSQMWITGTRIGRYELQINTGRVVPSWFKHEGDTFIGQPFASDEALIHARVLRGTSGVRVTAVDPKSGNEIWRNDVAVPIAMITQSAQGLHAMTSQASLFVLDRQALENGTTSGPIENPGGDGVAMRFENPVVVDQETRVLVNQEISQQIAIYDPSRPNQKLRIVTLALPEGELSGGAVFSGGGLFMPLNTGRAALMAYQTGKRLASPFQPVSDPVEVMKWTNPVVLADDPDQVVIADSRKSIYRLRAGDSIRELASGKIENELLGRLAAVGSTAIGATAGPSADFVIGFDMGSLDEKFKTLLDGRVIWGPVAAGGLCWLETDDKKLRAYDDSGAEKFAVGLPVGMPVGHPVSAGDHWVLCGAAGWIVVVDPQSGSLVGQTDIEQPISASPLAAGSRLLVPGKEGVVYVLSVPTGN